MQLPAGRKTRVASHTEYSHALGHISRQFWIEVSDMKGLTRRKRYAPGRGRHLRKAHVLLHVRTYGDTAQSLGDDTHAAVTQPQWP